MRNYLIAAFVVIPLACFAQTITFIDTAVFKSGAGDTTYWKDLGGKYEYVYVIVQDTGVTYTDSVACYSITKRNSPSDSVVTQIVMRRVASNVDYGASAIASTDSKYWLLDYFIDRLYIKLINRIFVNNRTVKLTIMGITHR